MINLHGGLTNFPSSRALKLSLLSGLILLFIAGGPILMAMDRFMLSKSSVTIAWNVGSQIDIQGFNVYRHDVGGTGFFRINELLIPTGEDVFSPQKYTLLDEPPENRIEFTYVIETIYSDGSASRTQPQVFSVTWKPGWFFWIGFIMLLTGLGLAFTHMIRTRKAAIL